MLKLFNMEKLLYKDFPTGLKNIPDKPKQLYIRGELPDENKYAYLTVVGPRKISNYGRNVCEYLISALADYPIVIVSGLALGTDALAHDLAIKTGLKTVAIPGSGLNPDVIYPATNKGLSEQIIKSGGCLLSEFEPDTRANTFTFPKRNRIMAGISKATLVIEASERSGTLITARLATEYNKDLMVVPGSIFSITSKGSNRFINQGATPISNPEEILSILGINKQKEELTITEEELSPIEKKIVSILYKEPADKDILIEKSKIKAGEISSILAMMEIKGLVKESLGQFRLTKK